MEYELGSLTGFRTHNGPVSQATALIAHFGSKVHYVSGCGKEHTDQPKRGQGQGSQRWPQHGCIEISERSLHRSVA